MCLCATYWTTQIKNIPIVAESSVGKCCSRGVFAQYPFQSCDDGLSVSLREELFRGASTGLHYLRGPSALIHQHISEQWQESQCLVRVRWGRCRTVGGDIGEVIACTLTRVPCMQKPSRPATCFSYVFTWLLPPSPRPPFSPLLTFSLLSKVSLTPPYIKLQPSPHQWRSLSLFSSVMLISIWHTLLCILHTCLLAIYFQ